MLPHIDAQHHPLNPLFERRVLIGGRDDRELAVFVDNQPRPAGAEAAGPRGVDFLNELGLRGKRRVDRGFQSDELCWSLGDGLIRRRSVTVS